MDDQHLLYRNIKLWRMILMDSKSACCLTRQRSDTQQPQFHTAHMLANNCSLTYSAVINNIIFSALEKNTRLFHLWSPVKLISQSKICYFAFSPKPSVDSWKWTINNLSFLLEITAYMSSCLSKPWPKSFTGLQKLALFLCDFVQMCHCYITVRPGDKGMNKVKIKPSVKEEKETGCSCCARK